MVSIQPGQVIKPGEVKMIQGEGMPAYKRPFDKGNLFVTFEIKFPSPHWCSPDQLKQLEAILPARAPLPSTQGKEVDEETLMDVDASQRQRSQAGPDDMDEDEEGAGPSVQCAQQ